MTSAKRTSTKNPGLAQKPFHPLPEEDFQFRGLGGILRTFNASLQPDAEMEGHSPDRKAMTVGKNMR